MGWIIEHIKQTNQQLQQNSGTNHLDPNLIYRGSRDGFAIADFHRLCDNKESTIVIMRVAGTTELLGGYSPLQWNLDDGYYNTNKSFIFALGDHELNGAIFSSVDNGECAIYCEQNAGPVFGHGEDLCFGYHNDFNVQDSCYAYQDSYSLPIRAIQNDFTIDEIEVFHVQRT